MLNRLKLELSDSLRFSPAVRATISWYLQQRNRFSSDSAMTKLNRETLAGRLHYRPDHMQPLEQRCLRFASEVDWSGDSWGPPLPDSTKPVVYKSIILKPPQQDGEKGVLFVSFEDNWLRLLRHGQIESLARDYELVISPTWSPPYDPPLFAAIHLWPGKLFVLLSNFSDPATFARLHPNVVPIPLLAASWVNTALMTPDPSIAKTFDLVKLANFAKYKRHFALFRALSRMDPSTRVLLLGRGWQNRTRETLEAEAELYGVRKMVTIMEDLPNHELITALQSAKAFVLMSKGEGSCVAVVEAMFANLPVGLLTDAHVGSKAFINDDTGMLLRPERLAADLTTLIERASTYRPREWVMSNGIDYAASTKTLNGILRERTRATGGVWTRDIVPHHWRPNPRFLTSDDRDAMSAAYSSFESRYGVGIHAADV